MYKELLFCIVYLYGLYFIFFNLSYQVTNSCTDTCNMQYILNTAECDTDLNCYEYYNNILDQCLELCEKGF